jgi:hypothetical protein
VSGSSGMPRPRAEERTSVSFGRRWPKRKLAASDSKRIVIGAWTKFDHGWIPTQQNFLDLTDSARWSTYFEPNSHNAMLAEHVWEHITPEEGLAAAKTCYTYLKPGAAMDDYLAYSSLILGAVKDPPRPA